MKTKNLLFLARYAGTYCTLLPGTLDHLTDLLRRWHHAATASHVLTIKFQIQDILEHLPIRESPASATEGESLYQLLRQAAGQKLVWLRQQQKLKIQEVTTAVNITRDMLNNLESGRRQPTRSQFKLFANLFGVPVEVLVL